MAGTLVAPVGSSAGSATATAACSSELIALQGR
jgi:hypothetical protein